MADDIVEDDSPELRIELEDNGAGTTVVLGGELDLSNADQLESTLQDLTKEAPVALEFDLADLDFMDSSGIAVLIRYASVANVSIVRCSESVRRLLRATGLLDFLRVAP